MKKSLALALLFVLLLAPVAHADMGGPNFNITLKNSALAFGITLVLELLTCYLCFKKKWVVPELSNHPESMKRILLTVMMGNIITVPVVLFLSFLDTILLFLLIPEAFAVITEMILLWALNRKIFEDGMRALYLSLILNIASFVVGGLLFILIAGVGLADPMFLRERSHA
ncbi:MAG: hypothetical protein NT157_04565 [Candidatus Micrarchaeota archaeon]|nr:hypothetical protein [Candidatus Micrarchaeota archaeon]